MNVYIPLLVDSTFIPQATTWVVSIPGFSLQNTIKSNNTEGKWWWWGGRETEKMLQRNSIGSSFQCTCYPISFFIQKIQRRGILVFLKKKRPDIACGGGFIFFYALPTPRHNAYNNNDGDTTVTVEVKWNKIPSFFIQPVSAATSAKTEPRCCWWVILGYGGNGSLQQRWW